MRTFTPQEKSFNQSIVLLWSTTGSIDSYKSPNHDDVSDTRYKTFSDLESVDTTAITAITAILWCV